MLAKSKLNYEKMNESIRMIKSSDELNENNINIKKNYGSA